MDFRVISEHFLLKHFFKKGYSFFFAYLKRDVSIVDNKILDGVKVRVVNGDQQWRQAGIVLYIGVCSTGQQQLQALRLLSGMKSIFLRGVSGVASFITIHEQLQ